MASARANLSAGSSGSPRACATANNLANISTRTALAHRDSYATTDDNALKLNSMGNILATCINSAPAGGQCTTLANDGLPCSARQPSA